MSDNSTERTSNSHNDAARALLGRGSVFAVGQAIQLGAAVMVVPLVTRLLDPGEYGELVTALAVLRVVAVVATFGLPAAITLEHFSGPIGHGRSTLLVALTTVGAAAVCSLGLAALQLRSNVTGQATSHAVQLALVSAALFAGVMACQALLQAQLRVVGFVALSITGTLGGQVLGLLLAHLVEPSASMYLLGLSVGYAAALAAGLLLTMAGHLPRWDWRAVGPALRVGLPTVPHSVALFALSVGDRIVIDRALGAEQVARYDLAYQIGALVIIALAAYNQAWAPIIYGADPAQRWSVLAHTSRLVNRLAALGCIGIALVAPLLLAVVAPSTYDLQDLLPVTTFTALSALPFVAYLSNVHILFQSRATRTLAWASPLSAVLGVAACVLLVDRWGLAGAAAATLVGYLILATLTRTASGSLADVPWDRRDLALIWSSTVAAVAALGLLPADARWNVVRLVAGLVVLGVAIRLARAATRPSPGRPVSGSARNGDTG